MGVLGYSQAFGIVVPYIAFGVFVLGIAYRVWRWANIPVPFHVPTVCGQQKSLPWIKSSKVESPSSFAGVVGRMALETLLFRSLFRNEKVELKRQEKLIFGGSKYLWFGGLAFHWSILVILLRHLRLVIEPVPSFVLFIQDLDGIFQWVIPAIYITDITILLALTYLLLRRLVNPSVRYISLLSDYLALWLIIGVAVSGVLMANFYRQDLVAIKELAMGLVGFHPSIPEGVGLAFYTHLFLVSVLVAYFPFSKMMHGAGVLFSPTRNLKNDSRMRRHVNPWNPRVRVHTYAEWEDEFRSAMKRAGLPVEKE